MSLQAPYYLSVDTVVIEDGTGSGIYRTIAGSVSFPAPEERDGDTSAESHNDAVRSFAVKIQSATPATAKAAFNALSRACRKDSLLRFRDGETDDLLECRIVKGRVSESSYDPLRRQRLTGYTIIADVTLITDPYWLAPWSADVTIADGDKAPADELPFYATVAAVGGDVDALLTATVLPAQATSMIALGVFPDAGTGFDPIDDYSTTADTTAYGGSKVTTGAYAADDAPIGSAPSLDSRANKGTHLLQARIANSADTVRVLYSPCSIATGYNISSSVTWDGARVAATVKTGQGFEVTTLGLVDVPIAELPGVDTESGVATESVTIEQTTDSGTIIFSGYEVTPATNAGPSFNQSITGLGEYFTGFEVVLRANPTYADGWQARLLNGAGAQLAVVSVDGLASGVTKIAFAPIWLTNGATYEVWLDGPSGQVTPGSISLAYGSGNPYAGGSIGLGAGTTANGDHTTRDLVFKVYAQEPLSFVCSTPVLFTDGSALATASLDVVTRIPIDCGALVATKAFSAGMGIRFDGDKRRAYVADADGIGHALLSETKLHGFPRLRPGVTNAIVVNAATPAAAAPTGATVTYAYRERYLNAVRD